MEAKSVEQLPAGDTWQYEPKWDGFRCIAFRDGKEVSLQSKSGQPLGRYFPELVEALLKLRAKQFVIDGEIVVPVKGRFSFDDLLMRIHPAASRVQISIAKGWLRGAGGDVDGVIAKRTDLPYQSGNRQGMVKVKRLRTADCVVGGFRYASAGKVVGSLLLGLYDKDGLLNHVGFTSSIKTSEKPKLTKKLESLIKPPGFTGRAPGGPSRWSTDRSAEWKPLAPKLVVEVQYVAVHARASQTLSQCQPSLQSKVVSDHTLHLYRLAVKNSWREAGA